MTFFVLNIILVQNCRSQLSHCLRRRSTAARLLRSWVRIPPGAWMSVCCECCVLSGRGICNELITGPEVSYWLWCVVCDLEKQTSWIRRRRPTRGLSCQEKKKTLVQNCVFGISAYQLTRIYHLLVFIKVTGNKIYLDHILVGGTWVVLLVSHFLLSISPIFLRQASQVTYRLPDGQSFSIHTLQ